MSASAPREFEWIDRIQTILSKNPTSVLVGIGDDTAVLKPTAQPILFCSDAMVEGVHFDLATTSAESLGYKALMACASDIAAMNGRWLHSTLSIALPQRLTKSSQFIDNFYEGVRQASSKWGAAVVGGDLTFSPSSLFIDVACIGEAQHPVRRGGAKVGDWILVSGTPGASKAGFEILKSGRQDLQEEFRDLVRAHLRPEARFDLVENLAQGAVPLTPTSMIDISDGLSSELHHLQRGSKLGFEVDLRKLPIHPQIQRAAKALGFAGSEVLSWALGGGEDYGLLATIRAEDHAQRLQLDPQSLAEWSVIGRVMDEPGVYTPAAENGGGRTPLPRAGYQHFG